MQYDDFVSLVSFCILMEHDGGILTKAPHYLVEKYKTRDPGYLDGVNHTKLGQYKELWARTMATMEGYHGD